MEHARAPAACAEQRRGGPVRGGSTSCSSRPGLYWLAFGPWFRKVELKVIHGRTDSGLRYLNVYVKHLGQAGFAVGGLLGEDDHTDVMIPPASCTHRTSLEVQTSGQTRSSALSVAMAAFVTQAGWCSSQRL